MIPDRWALRQLEGASRSQSIALVSLIVRDYDEAIAYFTDALNFRLVEDKPLGDKRWVVVAPAGVSGTSLLLNRNQKRLGQATQHLYVNVEDVDKHFERARKAGAMILKKPADTAMAIGVMVPQIRKAVGGTSRMRFAARNRNGNK